MDQQLLNMLPDLRPEELILLQNLSKDMTEAQKQNFFSVYSGKRREQQSLLLLTILGFFGIAGLQRFAVGDTVLGILYLFTVGFCGIGTIIDVININKITSDYNQKQAFEAANMVNLLMNR